MIYAFTDSWQFMLLLQCFKVWVLLLFRKSALCKSTKLWSATLRALVVSNNPVLNPLSETTLNFQQNDI